MRRFSLKLAPILAGKQFFGAKLALIPIGKDVFM
jgi:hypothetical protein